MRLSIYMVLTVGSLSATAAIANVGVGLSEPAAVGKCQTYVGQKVSPQPFSVLATLTSGAGVQKDEFETTAAFEARQAKAMASIPSTFIVRSIANHEYLRYDADTGLLHIRAYFFDNLNTSYNKVFGDSGTLPDGSKIYGRFDSIGIVVNEEERIVDRYTGSNVYGATVEVAKKQRDTDAIWERKAEAGEYLFPTQNSDAEIGSVAVSQEEARSLKNLARTAIVLSPKPPFFGYGNQKWEPRFDRPTEVNNDIFVAIADIQCALLLDGQDNVRAAWETR